MGLVTAPAAVSGAATPTTTVYDSTQVGATSLVSQCFECAQVAEIGNQVALAPGSHVLNNVTVTMESWGCEAGGVYSNDCISTDPTFNYPVTLNLYQVGTGGVAVGSPITSITQTFAIKYRPTSDQTNCPPANHGGAGLWFDGSACHYGIASNITFNLSDLHVPSHVIYGIAINTADYGTSPVACINQPTGCPANSLNVGLTTTDGPQPSVGGDPVLGALYQNTLYQPYYCDNGVTGSFRADLPLDYGSNPSNPAQSCWSANGPYTFINSSNNSYGPAPYYVPAVQFNASTCTTDCYVSVSGDDSNSGLSGSPFATMTHAIATVSTGGTVHVAAGTYNETVVVTKPLTLSGANAGISAAGPAIRGAESVIADPYASGNDVSLEIASPNVTVDGFSVQQATPVTCNSCASFGIEVDPTSSNATVQNNIVSGMTTSGTVGSPAGNPIGIYVAANGSSQPNAVSVNHNAVLAVTSLGTQHKSAQGILVGDSSNHGSATGLSIQSNRISVVSSASWGAYGIIFGRGTTGGSVQGNTVSAIHSGGWAHGISLDAPQVGLSVLNNSVSDVLAPNPAGGNVADIFIDPGDTSPGSGVIALNSLTATAAAGLVNATPGTVPATGNWWGCPGGPSTAGCTVAAPAASLVLTPWIVAFTPDLAKAGQPGFWPTSITASAGPVITSTSAATFNLNQPNTFMVTATGTPAPTLGESGALPVGVTFNPATGVLSGTPTSFGTFPITFTAHNGAYADSVQAFTLVSTSNTATITSALSLQTSVGKTVSFTVTTGGHPAATFTTVGLPNWLTLTPGTGLKLGTAKLAGTASAVGGNYTFTIHVTNGFGPDTTQAFTVHVLGFSSLPSVNFSKSGPPTQNFTISTAGAGAGVTLTATLASSLAGLTFTDHGDGTATISGQPLSTDKTQLVKITAHSGAAITSQKLAVGISN